MKIIQLTALEYEVLEKEVSKKFSEKLATEEELSAMVSVIHKAEALMHELEAYDESGDDLMLWFWNKYQAQETATTEE